MVALVVMLLSVEGDRETVRARLMGDATCEKCFSLIRTRTRGREIRASRFQAHGNRRLEVKTFHQSKRTDWTDGLDGWTAPSWQHMKTAVRLTDEAQDEKSGVACCEKETRSTFGSFGGWT
jgi:hypothetical protein